MHRLLLLFVVLLGAQSAWAAESRASGHGGQHLSSATALPQRNGVLAWQALSGVERVRENDRFVPRFPPSIEALRGSEIRLQGYMMPLERADMQKEFILTAAPPSCAFCVFAGPERAVDVRAKKPIRFGFQAIVVSGRLSLIHDDPMGLYYHLTDAVAVTP
jgi:hypothetical protein